MFLNGTTKPGWCHICSQHGLLNILSPRVKTNAQKKRTSFNILLLVDNAPGHPKELIKMYKINVVFMPGNTTSILQPTDQEIILNLKSYVKNTFHKAIAVIDSNSSDGSGQSKLKIFWEGFTILCYWEHLWFMGGVQNITISRSLEEIDSNTHGWLWGVQDLSGGSNWTAEVVKIARELGLWVEPEDGDSNAPILW